MIWKDVVVDVEITPGRPRRRTHVGAWWRLLGREDDFGVDVEIMIRKFHLPHHFPADVLQEAQEY